MLIEHARRAGRVIIDNLEKALDSRETTFLTVGDHRLYISGGASSGDSPTEAAEAIWNAYKLPEFVLCAMGFIRDYELPLSRPNGSGDHGPITDTDVVDAIALGLGTSPEWTGTETLEWIANTIGKVRNHPGGRDPREYREEFAEERAFDPREDGFLAKYLDEGTDEVDDKEERGLTVPGTTAGLKQLADQLKHHLEEAGYKTTQAAGSSVRSFTVNVWFPDGSYPVETITLTDSTKSQGFSWATGTCASCRSTPP
ncbi:hypothetical protein AB0A98_06635 [Streptomyces chrestomyceticus]|uniref:hypothetical protein n=1 Tax=Streptomyces chrestomyceticus TaxID=68185 RepID=UPI0033DFA981